jgi:tetratricopeptide (TPR) repeat protein
MGEKGYEAVASGAGSYRDLLKDKEQAVSLEQEQRVEKSGDVATRLISEYESRLPAEPNNLKLLRDLAELYTQKEQFDRALEYYDRLKKSEGGNDSSLDRAIALTMVRKFDFEIAQLDPAAADHPEQVARLETEKLAYQLQECRQRVERFPTDLVIRFEYAQLLFRAGKITEAIQELQKAQNNPNKRIPALSLLAQCFTARKMFDLAARTLQNALKEKVGFDDEKKELTYQLGCVLEKMNKKEEAMEQFKVIYESDIGYKDVSAKVDAYYAAQ